MDEKTILVQVFEGEEAIAEKSAEILRRDFPEYRVIVGIIKRPH